MSSKSSILWDKNSANPQHLRQPKNPPRDILKQSSTAEIDKTSVLKGDNQNAYLPHTKQTSTVYTSENLKDINELAAKSTLKPDAKPWYPSDVTHHHIESVTSSVQCRLNIHKKSSEIEINQTSSDQDLDLPLQNINDTYIEDYGYAPDIIRLKQIITTLTKDPGQFDNLLDVFMETLFPYLGDIIGISIIVQILVEQAINNPNFRYTGAKLCWYVEQSSPGFRAELPLQCKKQLEDNADLQNVVLFIAELYTQLPHLNVYGSLLIDSFKKLLENGCNNNIKCICQALKLTGYSLEVSNKSDLDGVLKELESAKNSVTGSTLTLLNSVLNLKQSNWGHSNESTESDDYDGFIYDGGEKTVFYQPDGTTLTSEESDFIAAHLLSNEYLSDASDPDELADPEPEMDEEIQEAFREFVVYSSSKQ